MKKVLLAVFCAIMMVIGLGGRSYAFNVSNASAEGELHHPADVDADWHLVLNEAIAYLAGWQQGGNPMGYAIRAAYLWQNGEYYIYSAEETPPLCWTFPTPAEGELGEGEGEGMEGEEEELFDPPFWPTDKQTNSVSLAINYCLPEIGVAFIQEGSGVSSFENWEVMFGRVDAEGNFQVEKVDDTNELSTCSLALMSDGSPMIAYYTNLQSELHGARKVGGVWQKELISDRGYRTCSLVINPRVDDACVFFNSAGDYNLYRSVYDLNATSWNRELLSYADACAESARYNPVTDSFSCLYRTLSWTGHPATLRYYGETGDGPVEGGVNSVGFGPSLAISEKDGSPHASYIDRTLQQVKYTYYNGEEWLSEVIDELPSILGDTSICLHPLSDEPRMAYGSDWLKLTVMQDGNWSIYPVFMDGTLWDNYGSKNISISMELTPDGKSIIACSSEYGLVILTEKDAWPFEPTPCEGEGEVEGETTAEGEGEVPSEGEVPVEGEIEGEGESSVEGEGETPAEGEGEVPSEGEAPVEGEVPAEGEGETPVEGEGEAPAEGEGEGEVNTLMIGAVYGNWASDSYPYSVSWRRQTYSTSQAVTHVDYTSDTIYAGAGSLAFTVNAEAGSEHTSQGEVYVDLRYPPAYEADQALVQQFQNDARVGVDLSDTTMSFNIFCPAGTSGSPDAPNGIQLFLLSLEVDENENESWYAAYADWHNILSTTSIPSPGELLEDQWNTIHVDMSDMAPFGHIDPNFDVTQVAILGVKYGLNENADTDVLDQTLFLDEFVIENEHSVLAHFSFDFVKDPIQALTDNDFNTIAVLVTQYMDSLSATDIHPVPGKTHSDVELAALLQLLQEREIPVVFKPHVDIQDEGDSWRGLISHDTQQDKETWFDNYTDFVVQYATLCEAYGVETFVIGTEYETLVGIENKALWEGVINAVRNVFSGTITYAANWDAYQNVSFWDLVDIVGIDAYFPLSNEADPTLEQIKAGWENVLWQGPEDETPRLRNWLGELRLFQAQVNKAVLFSEIGYRSTDYATREPWEYEEIRPINTALQQRSYQAFYEVFSQEEWFAGFFLWHIQPAKDDGGPWCSNFTPLNKPAIGVFKAK